MNKQKSLFIIDDDIDICLLLKVYFLRKNYEVNIAHSFCDALPRAKGIQPDIVFLKTAVCRNPEEDVRKLEQEVPYAEFFLDKYTIPNDYRCSLQTDHQSGMPFLNVYP